jgi:dolichyl-phosphate-mannose-protein mannosyltransferase
VHPRASRLAAVSDGVGRDADDGGHAGPSGADAGIGDGDRERDLPPHRTDRERDLQAHHTDRERDLQAHHTDRGRDREPHDTVREPSAVDATGPLAHPGGDLDSAPEDVRSVPEIERELRSRLLAPRPPRGLWGWLGPLLVAALAGAVRLIDLGRPRALVFDETYYVKQAYSLLRLGYEGSWGDNANERFVAGDFGALTSMPEYVVHPPVGKWLIAAGMQVLGPENPAGWRLGTALAGTLTVFLLARLARRLFASTLLGCLAGLFLALDGVHLVESRVALLDVFLGLFATAAFGAVVLDRERSRGRLARLTARRTGRDGRVGAAPSALGPRLGVRWWLVAAGVLCGLAIGVKWSGAYVLAVLGVLTVVWDVTARRAAGARWWLGAGLVRDGVPAFVSLVPVAGLTYVATWGAWFANPRAYQRDWAARHPELERPWLPDVLDSWLYFHRIVWDFHTGLSTPHGYEADPLGWIVQWRPTIFFWRTVPDPEVACGAERCAQAITSVGNPVVWWAGAVALAAVVAAAVRLRDWRAWTVLAGYAALWLPWFVYPQRTTFTFYSVALAPFVALALAYGLGLLLGLPPGGRLPPLDWSRNAPWVALGLVVLTVAVAAFFYPVWTAAVIDAEQWRLRVWLPTWT